MPPRWLTWAIIAFWLGMTGWLTYQQYSLRQRAGEPPPFTIDLTDEVGANEISWHVLINGKKEGQAYSSVKFRRSDRTFAFKSMFRANDVELAKILHKFVSNYRVNQNGELLEIECDLVKEQDANQQILLGASITGKVKEGIIEPDIWAIVAGTKFKVDPRLFGISPEIKVSGNFLNPMHMVNKVHGLHEGQEWVIQLLKVATPESMSLPMLMAKVNTTTLSWYGKDVPCFLIEYREKNMQQVHARTWVRQRDGVVLQQEADYMGRKLLFQREKDRKS